MGKVNDTINQILSIKRDIGKARQVLIRIKEYIGREDMPQVMVDKGKIMAMLQNGLDALAEYD